jgi:hypothetical protein
MCSDIWATQRASAKEHTEQQLRREGLIFHVEGTSELRLAIDAPKVYNGPKKA